jgi:hypothetical protein
MLKADTGTAPKVVIRVRKAELQCSAGRKAVMAHMTQPTLVPEAKGRDAVEWQRRMDAAGPNPPAVRDAAAAAAGIGSAAVAASKQAPDALLQAAPRECVSKGRDGIPRHSAAGARAAGSAPSRLLAAAAAAGAAIAVAAKCLCKDDWVGQASQQDVPLAQELLAQHTCRGQEACGAGCGALSQGSSKLDNTSRVLGHTTSRQAGRQAGKGVAVMLTQVECQRLVVAHQQKRPALGNVAQPQAAKHMAGGRGGAISSVQTVPSATQLPTA